MSEFKWPPEGSSTGDVIGPGSSTNDAIARFDGTSGKLIQNSTVTLSDAGVVAGATIDGDDNTLQDIPLSGIKTVLADATEVVRRDSSGAMVSGPMTVSDAGNVGGINNIDATGTVIADGEITALNGTTGEIALGVSAGRAATTGLLTGGDLSIDADPTKFDVSAGAGVIVDKWTDPLNPVYTYVAWNAFNAQTVTNLATQNNTSIGINSAGNIVQFTVSDYDTAKRDYIMLGTLIHASRTQIDSVNNAGTNSGYDIGETVLDLALAVGSINLTGNVYGPNGANLNINKSAGTAFSVGVNIKTSKKYPNTVTSPSQTAPTFFYTYRNGSGGYAVATTTNINPDQYDTGTGTLVAVSNNKWTIQRIYAAENFTVVEYGQNQYDTEAEALSAIRTETHVSNPDLATLLLRSYLVVKKGTTALNNTAVATFVEASRFGGGTSNSATTSTTNLQGAYDNSVTPEILTDATRGALTIRRGSAADTDNVFEGQNNAGTVTFAVTGNGVLTAVLTNSTGLPLSTGVTGTLPIANGGTGQTTATAAFDALAPTTTLGDIIYHNGTDNVRLAGDTSNTKKWLRTLSTAGTAAAPTWEEVDQVKGITSGSAVAAGYVGETIPSTGVQALSLTATSSANTYVDAAETLTLTAGRWEIMVNTALYSQWVTGQGVGHVAIRTSGGTVVKRFGYAPLVSSVSTVSVQAVFGSMIVDISSSTTYKLSIMCNSASSASVLAIVGNNTAPLSSGAAATMDSFWYAKRIG